MQQLCDELVVQVMEERGLRNILCESAKVSAFSWSVVRKVLPDMSGGVRNIFLRSGFNDLPGASGMSLSFSDETVEAGNLSIEKFGFDV